ncbi:MAG: zinc ribbon domain-containing protein [Ruminococcus sp.]|uniref:zinc ribbon domain-containing protein n=1 Tax=Ruminococcus sp. TaxID=41978 RepID=UPI0025E981DE|nr:zinc ribbon domain-containing protein [Ruminococcus sp.]MBR0530425.1 zinc ribbon domain-containing protein [Ruminococcus sp.]
MNGINNFMNGKYKIIGPAVSALFALFATIGVNLGFQAYKANKDVYALLGGSFDMAMEELGLKASTKTSSGGTGFVTFLQILFWIIAIVYIGFKVLEVIKAIKDNPQIAQSLKPATAPAQNYAQPQQFAQPQQNMAQPQQIPAPIPTPAAAPAAGEKFCTQCGAKVPAGNAFCTGCGAKLN